MLSDFMNYKCSCGKGFNSKITAMAHSEDNVGHEVNYVG
jgi:hypothetical protein